MMSGYYDVYCLAPIRNSEAIECFLQQFAPTREQTADEYELPQNADVPDCVFYSVDQVIAHCVNLPTESYGIYWRCLNEGDPAHAMVFFTPDSAVLFGLSVTDNAQEWLDKMKSATGSSTGWIGFETPPPDTAREFIALAKEQCE